MLSNLTGWHFLIILVVILLLFGAPKLPLLARSLGQSMKIFKNEIKSDTVDKPADSTDATTTPARTDTTDGTAPPVVPGDQTKP